MTNDNSQAENNKASANILKVRDDAEPIIFSLHEYDSQTLATYD